MLKALSSFGPSLLLIGLLAGERAQGSTIHVRAVDDARISDRGERLEAEVSTVHIRLGADAPERYAASNIKVYEDLVVVRDADLLKFDREHPFYAELMTNSTFAEKLVGRWERDEQRFEYWHPYLWRVLDGYQELNPTPSGPIVSPPPSSVMNPDPPPPSSIPEPSAWLLLTIGLSFVGLRKFGRLSV